MFLILYSSYPMLCIRSLSCKGGGNGIFICIGGGGGGGEFNVIVWYVIVEDVIVGFVDGFVEFPIGENWKEISCGNVVIF
ncbi:hypothetical protein Glove_166g21 [Diversispora epigaea]|uniref:Uncharacterized protein n=1 Tax=Diversispora epigaea TaxID=1348612 RepID=A0A397IZN7_9GLOM|nr:hypothetical protein Glove_166g21 [Diversispora epigaea]